MKFEKEYVTKKGNTLRFKLSANRLIFGILFIACAVLIILDAVSVPLGFLSGIPAWVLILTVLNLIWLIDVIIKLKLSEVFFPIAFIFMLLEKDIAKWCGLGKENIINNWLVFLCAVLLCIGAKLISPKSKFTKSFAKSGSHRASRGTASNIYVDCASGEDTASVHNELGACNVYFSNTDSYIGGMTLHIHNELGALNINVPSDWNIVTNIVNELGAVTTPDGNEGAGKTIFIKGRNELGAVNIKRV